MKATKRKVVFEHDIDPDFSWLEQSHYDPSSPDYDPVYRNRADMRAKRNPIADYANPDNHVALCMLVYEMGPGDDDWKVVDSLSSIDFLADSDDWQTGTFYRLRDIKPRSYLRSLAKDAGLR